MGAKHSAQGSRSYNSSKYKPKKTNNNCITTKCHFIASQWAQYRVKEAESSRDRVVIILENDASVECAAISPLKLNLEMETETRLHFKIFDPNKARFEVKLDHSSMDPSVARKMQSTQYEIDFSERPFGLVVTRRSTGQPLFDSTKGKFHFEDQKLRITTAVHSRCLYGLGEHQKPLLIDTTLQHKFCFWARDQPPKENTNLYGVHPFFMAVEADGNAYGVFLLNSCAMEISVEPGDPAVLTYTTNGGILDFYVFAGPSPVEVVQQYLEVIGNPCLPPYWGLGFHLCRWGYDTTEELKKVIDRTRATKIPYESQWTDVDLMDQYEVWTYKDAELPAVVKDLHRHGQRYVMIVDPGVGTKDKNRQAFTQGMKLGVFIRDHEGSKPVVGKVWPGETVFPDFSHPDIYDYWLSQAQSLYRNIPFDGMWLDMNEPANFVSGCLEDCHLVENHPLDNPTFLPGSLEGKTLFDKTLCPSAQQHAGPHYHLHNLYGHMQMKVSQRVCAALRGKRSLIISRSTFPGSGLYGGHWTGDNNSSFKDLRHSISAMLDFNMFGIPLVGADIGGFWNSCSEELMVRWMQVGAFYPFMRNHNSSDQHCDSKSQDPGVFSLDAQSVMADVVSVRYSLLPYLYTLLYENHVKGHPAVRPLFFLFPRDKRTHGIDEQFMWGTCLLFSPCLTEGADHVDAYFPFDVWFDFFTGQRMNKVGEVIRLPTPLNSTNIHIRGGSVLVTQSPARNTALSRQQPFGLLAALCSKHTASGKLYWDDGECLDPIASGAYNLIKFSIKENRLTSQVVMTGFSCSMRLRLVQVFGLYVKPDKVTVNGAAQPYAYDDTHGVLQLDRLDVSLLEQLVIEW